MYVFLTYICLMNSNKKMFAMCLTQCWTHNYCSIKCSLPIWYCWNKNSSSSIFHPFFCIHNLQIGLGCVVDICEFKCIMCVSISTSIHWDITILFEGWSLIAICVFLLEDSKALWTRVCSLLVLITLAQHEVWPSHSTTSVYQPGMGMWSHPVKDIVSILMLLAKKAVCLYSEHCLPLKLKMKVKNIPWESLACVVYGLNSGTLWPCFWLMALDKLFDCSLPWSLPSWQWGS